MWEEFHGIGDAASTQAMADEDHLKDMDYTRHDESVNRIHTMEAFLPWDHWGLGTRGVG